MPNFFSKFDIHYKPHSKKVQQNPSTTNIKKLHKIQNNQINNDRKKIIKEAREKDKFSTEALN